MTKFFRTQTTVKEVAGVRIRNTDLGLRTRRRMFMVMVGLATGRRDKMGYDPDAPPVLGDMTASEIDSFVTTMHEADLATAALEFVRGLAAGPYLPPDRMTSVDLTITNGAREILGMPVLVADGDGWKEDDG